MESIVSICYPERTLSFSGRDRVRASYQQVSAKGDTGPVLYVQKPARATRRGWQNSENPDCTKVSSPDFSDKLPLLQEMSPVPDSHSKKSWLSTQFLWILGDKPCHDIVTL